MDLQTVVSVSMLPVSRARAAALFNEIRHQPAVDPLDAILEACGIPPSERPRRADEAVSRAARALKEARLVGAEPVAILDPRYPPLLSFIPDPPPVLWVKGEVERFELPAVAIVGSRAATAYALEVAARLGEELAERGIAVVSGLARGVDSAAHRGCVEAGGSTIAVLGSGVDRIYPVEHRSLALKVCKTGMLVSELGPGAAPLPEHFPLRNRIISGISLATVVVEASEKSGSLITARCALEQGRDVMAVPGSILSGRNRGSHGLLKDGAKVVETADDILEELGWPASTGCREKGRKPKTDDPLLTKMDAGEVYGLEELMRLTGVSVARLLPRLTELELAGAIVAIGAGRYTRSGPFRRDPGITG